MKFRDLWHGMAWAAGIFWACSGLGEALIPIPPPEGPTSSSPSSLNEIKICFVSEGQTTAPFRLGEDSSAGEGGSLLLPDGAGSPDRTGRLALSLDLPAPGRYTLWLHAKWKDSCGNSIGLKMGENEILLGEDHVFGTWHWVKGGIFPFPKGPQTLWLLENEDGIAVDQILLTRNPLFVPSAPYGRSKASSEIRRFADDFTRSPGHGMESWDLVSGQWEIAFSLDPNRIPNQYALSAKAPEGLGSAMIKGPSWKGSRVAFSLWPSGDGEYGVVLGVPQEDRGVFLGILLRQSQVSAVASGVGLSVSRPLADNVRPGQWHRVVVETWAWVLRILVDDQEVLYSLDGRPDPHPLGLYVRSGWAVFDDVSVEEIPWQGEDGQTQALGWTPAPGARWFRSQDSKSGKTLFGKAGALEAPASGFPVQEVVLEGPGTRCRVTPEALQRVSLDRTDVSRWLASAGCEGPVTLRPDRVPVRLHRVAIRYGPSVEDGVILGPYHFTEKTVVDPFDYLDFTPEERAAMSRPEAIALEERKPNDRPVLSEDNALDNSLWVGDKASWSLKNQTLKGKGPDATVALSREVGLNVEGRLRLRLSQGDSAARIFLYAGADPGPCIRVQTGSPPSPQIPQCLSVSVPPEGAWHDLSFSCTDRLMTVQCDKGVSQKISFEKKDGGRVLFEASRGTVEFDDIEFRLPRRSNAGFLYVFDRRETDWWREGEWIDHGGISCVMASSWISLIAPQGRGMSWNKRSFGPDLRLSFDVEENTEWLGWDKTPTHVHYPFENICAILAQEDRFESGYRLEVNASGHTQTILYRDTVQVASVPQDQSFPIRFVGDHSPFLPRRNRITLVKRGAHLRALINDREVLAFEDPIPLNVHRVGIGGFDTRINFAHVEVESLSE